MCSAPAGVSVHIFTVRLFIWTCNISLYREEDTALNVRVGWLRKMTIFPLGSCTCLSMSNFTPLLRLLFGANVELSSLLNVSFNINIYNHIWERQHSKLTTESREWLPGAVLSQRMVSELMYRIPVSQTIRSEIFCVNVDSYPEDTCEGGVGDGQDGPDVSGKCSISFTEPWSPEGVSSWEMGKDTPAEYHNTCRNHEEEISWVYRITWRTDTLLKLHSNKW